MILDELRSIRQRMDAAMGPYNGQIAPPPPPPRPLPEDTESTRTAEIIEPKIADVPEPAATVQKAPTESHANPAPAPKPKNTDDFGLKEPKSAQEAAELFSAQKKRIENMMAVAQFAWAEKLAQALLATLPHSDQAEAMLETVRRESTAFRTEQQSRLFAEFQKCTESRQWLKAQAIGEQLIEKYPASEEGQTIAASMDTVAKNAHFEEARTLRDRIGDLIKRKRYAEAIEIAEDIIRRFPNTQVAKQLRLLLPDLKKRDKQFR